MISSYQRTSHLAAANEIATAILGGRLKGTSAWEATTNRRSCGGLNEKARAVIHRALKRAGYVFFLALWDDNGYRSNSWGIADAAEIRKMEADPSICHLVTGYTLRSAAVALSQRGDASVGWKTYWGWN